MFSVNDVVMYSIHGICKVKEIHEKTSETESDYYVLSPIFSPTSQIFVPLNNTALLSRLSPVISREEMSRIIDALPQRDTIWISDANTRKERYKQILLSGNRDDISVLIKTLFLHKKNQQARGKKLHLADERYLKEAEKMFYSEIAYLFDMHPSQVLRFILSKFSDENDN